MHSTDASTWLAGTLLSANFEVRNRTDRFHATQKRATPALSPTPGSAATEAPHIRTPANTGTMPNRTSVTLALFSSLLFALHMNHTAVWFQYSRWIFEHPLGYLATVGLMWMQPNLMDVLAL